MIYPGRYECEPRKREVYVAMFDAIVIYGVKRSEFKLTNFNVSRREGREIWKNAISDANGNSRYDYITR